MVPDKPFYELWPHTDFLETILLYYADKGNVQFCCTLLIILQKRFDLATYPFAETWFHSYIGMLSLIRAVMNMRRFASAVQDVLCGDIAD